MSKQVANFPAGEFHPAVHLGPNDYDQIRARLVQWSDGGLSLIMDIGAAYVQVQVTPEQCQAMAAELQAASRSALGVL